MIALIGVRAVLGFGLLALVSELGAQVNTGELRVKVVDLSGAVLKAAVVVSSPANRFQRTYKTDDTGELDLPALPYGLYTVAVERQGFAAQTKRVELRSALPVERVIMLWVATAASVEVVAAPLIDFHGVSSVKQIGSGEIRDRVGSLPGRSVQDLIVSQPGWLYEGNAVLHPRGSEYQTQFVVDGIPLTDNRSPSFGPELEADDLDSIGVYTAGFPAEYGRKLGGVIELNTHTEKNQGVHGVLLFSGGSYDTVLGYGRVQDVRSKESFGVSASGSMSAHYLNPVVQENYTNRGTTGDFSANYHRTLSPADRLVLNIRHEFSRFEIPNELLQQQANQLQTGNNGETSGTVRYDRTQTPFGVATLSGMVRSHATNLDSNAHSTPILAFQHNSFGEGYFKGTLSWHARKQEFKVGLDADNTFLHEYFRYSITDASRFDPETPASLSFLAARPALEQSAFVEDMARLGNWTLSAGLRWDHYQLLLNQNAFSPRVSVGRYVPSLKVMVHGSFDRVFQTPSIENLLISSSMQIEALSDRFLRLPVQPSRGNFYEGGLDKEFADRMSVAATVYRRDLKNFADDDQLLNTGISYPISFRKAVVYGAEGKWSLVRLGGLTGFVSYSYMVGNVWFPVTGGLFLNDDAAAVASQTSGHLPISQDQRNTLRTRFRYQAAARVWIASGVSYGSGLPFAFSGNPSEAEAEYSSAVVNRIDFDRGRVRPSLAINASLGVDLYQSDRFTSQFQVDGDNLNNRLNVIDFGGLFSGNAIGPKRSFALRVNTSF